MKSILIAAKTAAICDGITELLAELDCKILSLTDGCSMRSVDVTLFDIIIVSTPLSDEFGLDLVAELHGKTDSGLIVLAKADIADEVQQRLKFTSAFVLPRPFSKGALLQAVRFSDIAKQNVRRLEDEKAELSKQITEMKLINRAKSCLMQYLGMTEEQAHKHIQKQAMDLRKTQLAVAEDILKMYVNKVE